jgi:hypothetical protein
MLARAADRVQGGCMALAHELRRNHLEEGGEPGKVPAHFTLFSSALLEDLGLLVNGHVPTLETARLVGLHDWLIEDSSVGRIAGGYYATEGVAIRETRLLQAITDRYAELTVGRRTGELPKLDYYYQLHLAADHDAATVDGLSVEAAHIEGLARFVRNYRTFSLDLAQILDGWLQLIQAMTRWWTDMAATAHTLT